MDCVGDAQFLKQDRYFAAVWCGPSIKVNHGYSSFLVHSSIVMVLKTDRKCESISFLPEYDRD